jgi:hypothetical protein
VIATLRRPARNYIGFFGPNPEPTYIIETPGVQTWTDVDENPNTRSFYRPVHGIPTPKTARAFEKALANHQVRDAAANGALKPCGITVLTNLNFGIAGLGAIRETGEELSTDFLGYSRGKLKDAVLKSLHALTDNFPSKNVYVGFWKVTDATTSPQLWEELRTTILKEFDGVKNPKVGFWQENLAASENVTTGIITGYPNTTFAAPLYRSQDSTHIMFQMLESWVRPARDPGQNSQYHTGGCHELCLHDVWHDLLRSVCI